MEPHGLLNLNKPAGQTSRDVVNRVQRCARPAKAGHAGTLDPLATGVLVVCVGAATRLIEHVQAMPKEYVGTFLLGRTSPTEDIEGAVTLLDSAPIPSRAELLEAAGRLVGPIEQRPPSYSALKVGGRRAYARARAGEQLVLAPRPIVVHELEIARYEYPELTLRIVCGSGTYVRSLGRDLAEAVGTGAVMAALERRAVGCFRIEEAADPAALSPETWRGHLLDSLCALEGVPRITLSDAEVVRVHHGQPIAHPAPPASAAEIAAVDAQGRLVALLAPLGDGQLRPTRNFPRGP